MLTLFRRYQRFIFIFTTVVIIASFSFFGTVGGMIRERNFKGKEEVLCKGADGSKITQYQVEGVAHLIGSSHFDFFDDKVSSPSWLNEGVLEHCFLETSLGEKLAQEVWPAMSLEVGSALKKFHAFQTYRHPSSPFLSAEALWGQFLPELIERASQLSRVSDGTSSPLFPLLSKAYLEHVSFPSTLIKRMIAYQEKQDERLSPDERLAYADVSVFGLHSAKEWFGQAYLQAAAKVILQGAAYARNLGLSVSLEEARQELLGNVQQASKRFSEEVDPQMLYPLFLQQVQKMGFEEGECLALWQQVALFKKLLAHRGEVVIEPLLAQEFLDFAKERALLQVFSFSNDLKLKDTSDVLKLHIYLNAIALPKSRREPLAFPTELLSLEEVEKKHPELVRREYTIEYAELDVKKAAAQVGIKQMWEWQVSEGWAALRSQFFGQEEIFPEERFAFLEGLEEGKRAEVDAFSREKMVLANPNRLKEMLAALPLEKSTFSVSSTGEGIALKGIKDKRKFADLLEGDIPSHKDLLSFYSDDEFHYYAFNVVERGLEKRILTFKEASDLGVMRQMLDQKLEGIYPDVRKKDPGSYMKQGGGWEPLAHVKEKVSLALFPELLKAIETEYASIYGKEAMEEEKKSSTFYAKHRMLAPLQTALEIAQKGEASQEVALIAKQWQIQEEVKTVLKSQKEFFPQAELFALEEGQFSSVCPGACFFRMLSHLPAEKASLEEVRALTAPLQEEELNLRIQELMQWIRDKGVF